MILRRDPAGSHRVRDGARRSDPGGARPGDRRAGIRAEGRGGRRIGLGRSRGARAATSYVSRALGGHEGSEDQLQMTEGGDRSHETTDDARRGVRADAAVAVPAQAQLNGSHTLGDFGVQSGSQPPPGFYAALFYLRYDTDTIKDADGNTVRLSPSSPGSLAVSAAAPLAWYVSKAKLLGRELRRDGGASVANASLEAPAFALSHTVDTSFADMLVRPLDLGWHTARADVTAGFQFYTPTGRYERGGSDNIGKGMWTTSRSSARRSTSTRSGPPVSPRRPSGSSTATRRTPTSKSARSSRSRAALGKSFLGGGLIVGAAYYAQWKLTEDQLAEFVLPGGGSDRR